MIPIAIAADANFHRGLAMAVASILKHTTSAPVDIHILDGGLTSQQKSRLNGYVRDHSTESRIQFHEVSLSDFEGFYLMYGNALTYARLLIPKILPDLDEVIYGDADIYYGIDLNELWTLPTNGRAAIAAPDPVVGTLGNDCRWIDPASVNFTAPYFNAGVMKINLRYWRETRIAETSMAMARTEPRKYLFWDQSLLNILIGDDIQWMEQRFNYLLHRNDHVDHGQEPCDGKNLHYIFQSKPWSRYSRRRSFRYWRREYRKLISPWPAYQLSAKYWAGYFWADWIVKGPFIQPVCRLLLATQLHRILPVLNESKLRAHLEH